MTAERRKEMMEKKNDAPDFERYNGIRIVDVDDGFCAVEVEMNPNSLNIWGIPHGGLLYTMADLAAGYAVVATTGKGTVTTSGSMNFLRTTYPPGKLRAEARLDYAGKSTSFYRVEVRDDAKRLLATASFTMHHIEKKSY
jgi:acyl-CoA thioesterase